MFSFSPNDLKRSSIISNDSSNESIHRNKEEESILNEKCKRLLFFGPLMLCVILLIVGIVLFIAFGKQIRIEFLKKTKQEKIHRIQFPNPYEFISNYEYKSLSCDPPIDHYKHGTKEEPIFANNQLNCGLNNSFVINYYYINKTYPIHPNDIITINHIKNLLNNRPFLEFNKEFLSKTNSISFIFILAGEFQLYKRLLVFWIRYISLSNKDDLDICYPKSFYIGSFPEHLILLLYGTNSNKYILKAKTICYSIESFDAEKPYFLLRDYIKFNKLNLIASTHYYLKYDQSIPEID